MGQQRREEGEISGGRLVNPVQGGRYIQGGRYVPKHNIGIDYDNAYHFGGIAAFVNGGMLISDAWIEVNNVRLNPAAVTEGQAFVVHVALEARDIAGGAVTAWAICVTVIDSAGELYNYNFANSISELAGQINTNDLALNRNALTPMVMPARDISLRIKGWGTDILSPTDPPPMNLW